MRLGLFVLVPFVLIGACSSGDHQVDPNSSDEALTGCHGKAASTVPAGGSMILTTFGGPGEGQKMSCGQSTKNGTWYYSASRQRYGCGAHLKVEARGKCVVVEADDYGPDVCVETRAGKPILDASPMVSKYLFGAGGAGWSDHLAITVTQVAQSTPLGPCKGGAHANGPPNGPPQPNGPNGPSGPSGPNDPNDPNDPNGGGCTDDVECTQGAPGAEMICEGGACVQGCRIDDDCADPSTYCDANGQCQ
jgi:hypothetical protein